MNTKYIVRISNTITILGIISILYMHFFVPIPSKEFNKCIYSACAKLKVPKIEYKKSLQVRKHISEEKQEVVQVVTVSQPNIPKIKRISSFSFNENKRLERFNFTTKITSITYTGGKSLPVFELESMVKNTIDTLPHIKKDDRVIKLITETFMVESDGGRSVKNYGGNYGIAQLPIPTVNEVLTWLKQKHSDVYQVIQRHYKHNLSLQDNLKYNINFAICMSVTLYWKQCGGDFYRYCNTVENRAKLWKTIYNTFKGKGSVASYISRVNSYKKKVDKGELYAKY